VSTATAVRPPEDPISQTALNCYLTTVIAVAECLAGVCPEIGIPYQERLMRVPRRLGFHATARSLEESRLALVSDLKEFGDITGRHFADMPRKAGEIVSLIARLSNIVGERNERHNAALGRLAEQMQFAAELDDAVRLRQMAAQQSIGLRASSETLEREIADLLGEITREARDLETRIRQPEAFSAMDRLTGLLNRLGMERQLNLCLERPNPFCVLVFAWIPDPRIEPAEREQMTRRLATRLVDQVRPNDIVGRWAPEQFVVIFQSRMRDAEARSRQIARNLTERYALKTPDGDEHLEITANVNIVEPEPPETAPALFSRIDRAHAAE